MEPNPKFFRWLASTNSFKTLVDIGANDGAFGAFLKQELGIQVVHAIEPLARHEATLRQRDFIVHPFALSDADSTGEFFIAESDTASSLLAPSQRCLSEYPQVRIVEQHLVQVRTLDGLALDPLPQPFLIKLDAQGVETAIIRGGRNTFSRAQAVYVEMSFVPLYEGSALFGGVHAELSALGLQLRGFRAQHEGANGEPLFAHALYLRN